MEPAPVSTTTGGSSGGGVGATSGAFSSADTSAESGSPASAAGLLVSGRLLALFSAGTESEFFC